jgi:hypothetical protein
LNDCAKPGLWTVEHHAPSALARSLPPAQSLLLWPERGSLASTTMRTVIRRLCCTLNNKRRVAAADARETFDSVPQYNPGPYALADGWLGSSGSALHGENWAKRDRLKFARKVAPRKMRRNWNCAVRRMYKLHANCRAAAAPPVGNLQVRRVFCARLTYTHTH